MGWSFRRSKSFGLFRFNFSKSGVGISFGVPGARVGVNAKGKKYLRGGISGTGLYYQSSLPGAESQPGQAPQSSATVSPLMILIVVIVVALIIFAMSSSKPTPNPAPVVPVPQIVAPVAAPVAPRHLVKHKRKHAVRRAPATAEEAPAAMPEVVGEGDITSR